MSTPTEKTTSYLEQFTDADGNPVDMLKIAVLVQQYCDDYKKHNHVENKPLTVDFIKSLGFKLTNTIHEVEFYYEDYHKSNLEYCLTIFFNYFNNGKTSYDVEMDGYELENVNQNELLTLLKILPKNKQT